MNASQRRRHVRVGFAVDRRWNDLIDGVRSIISDAEAIFVVSFEQIISEGVSAGESPRDIAEKLAGNVREEFLRTGK